MSQSGGYNKSIFRDKRGREIKHESDFLSTRIRHADGSHGTYRAGKLIGKEDAGAMSKFHTPTPVSTIVAEQPVEKDTAARIRKKFDVNAKALSL